MFQDSKGFLWIGTYYGLNKYDGYSFKHYYAMPHDTLGLQSNVITSLCEDSSHTIWVGTRGGGLCALDRKTDRFHHYGYNPTNLNSLSSNDVTALLCDSKGRLWVGTLEDGLNYFNPAKGLFQRYSFPKRGDPGASPNRVISLFESPIETIIVNASGSPSEFDPQTAASHLLITTGGQPISSLSIWPLGTSGGCLFEEAESPRTKIFSVGDLPAFEHLERWGSIDLNGGTYFVLPAAIGSGDTDKRSDSKGSWVDDRSSTGHASMYLLGTTNGLFVLDPGNRSIKPFYVDSHEPGNTYDNVFTCGLFDKQGRLWIGTFNGLYILTKDALIFKKHSFQSSANGPLTKPQTVRSLFVDKQGKLLAGTLSGKLFEWSDAGGPDNGTRKDNEFHASTRISGREKEPMTNPINSIAEDPSGNTWFAATLGPCFLQPAGQRELTSITSETSSRRIQSSTYFHPHVEPDCLPPGRSGYVVYCDRQARIWLGSETKNKKERAATLLCYDTRSGYFSSYSYPGSEEGRSGIHGVYAILEDRNSNFWIGTADGLFQLDRSTRKFKSFVYTQADEHSLNYNAVTTLHEDARGRFWIGTWGGGLDLMDRKSGEFTHFLEQDGLPNNIIYSMLEDKAGTLWMATGRGISHFNADLRTFSNYDLDDGLLDNEFQPNAAAMLPSGEMFFGGNHGVTSFFPEQVVQQVPRAPLVVTSFTVSNRPYLSELVDGDTVTLAYDQNDLSFDFASLDFSGPQKKRYAYMLQGEETRWLQCANRNSGAYNNLVPGHYILRIKSANAQGVWDATGIAINIFIATPIWGTWWFQILVGLSVAVLILTWALRIRTRNRSYQLMLDHALENERMNLAGELHDGPLQDLYATRFLLEGARSDIETSDDRSSGEHPQHGELNAILKKVREDLRAVTGELQLPRFEHGLSPELAQFLENFGEHNPKIRILSEIQPEAASPIRRGGLGAPDNGTRPDSLPLKVQQNLFRIFRTALANIKKHSEAGEVSVRFLQEGRKCAMEIVDDGRGFEVPSILDALSREKHYGLILMHAYANEIGAKLRISSIPGKETRIAVTYLTPRLLWNSYMLSRRQKI